MRNLPKVSPLRLACVFSASAMLAFGPVGCGGSGPATGTSTQLAPEVKQANDNMENFMKNQKK